MSILYVYTLTVSLCVWQSFIKEFYYYYYCYDFVCLDEVPSEYQSAGIVTVSRISIDASIEAFKACSIRFLHVMYHDIVMCVMWCIRRVPGVYIGTNNYLLLLLYLFYGDKQFVYN